MWFVYAEKRKRIDDQLDRVEFVYAVCDKKETAEELKEECEAIVDSYTTDGKHLNTFENVTIEEDEKNKRLIYI